ncbi:MAG: protein translocase subunit SecF [Pseudomonadota bacterium]|nr:protein translocase subunit SecF [Pseudomonadota bacterium]
MKFHGLRFVPDDTSIPFMRMSRYGFFLSGVLCIVALLLFLAFDLNYGIDFKGGTLIEIRTAAAADLGDLRSRIGELGLGDAELQEFGGPNDVLIRLEAQAGGEQAQNEAVRQVRQALGSAVEFRRVEVVGPKVSAELTQQGIIAVVFAIILVLIYIWFRFEWQFSIGAVASLLHDVIITVGVLSVLRIEFNLNIIAAILTIIGYSLNDTVVVYDRIREYLRKYKKMPFAQLIDASINSTLARTMLTGTSTLLALLSLYIFGGEVIRGFTFTMIFGVVVGTYSSIFVAAPVLILLGSVREAASAGEKARS